MTIITTISTINFICIHYLGCYNVRKLNQPLRGFHEVVRYSLYIRRFLCFFLCCCVGLKLLSVTFIRKSKINMNHYSIKAGQNQENHASQNSREIK